MHRAAFTDGITCLSVSVWVRKQQMPDLSVLPEACACCTAVGGHAGGLLNKPRSESSGQVSAQPGSAAHLHISQEGWPTLSTGAVLLVLVLHLLLLDVSGDCLSCGSRVRANCPQLLGALQQR